MDVAVAEDRQQDIVGPDVSRHLDGFDQQDGRGWIRVKRQPRLPGRADRQRTDLDPVLERRVFELRLRPRIQKMRAAIGWKRQAHLDSIEPDLAREGDLRDIASLPKVPVRHADSDRQRVCGGRLNPRPSAGSGRPERVEGRQRVRGRQR